MAGVMIVFSGKGGSGKTTLSAMTIRELIRQGKTPVLAVDADPNATLALALGIEQGRTIGSYSKEEGVAEIHLARITGKQIPTRGKYGKDTSQSKDSKCVRVVEENR